MLKQPAFTLLPLRWRARPATSSTGILYQFVREFVVRGAGEVRRDDLRAALQANPIIATRLAESQGLRQLLANMQQSGWIKLKGDLITATPKTMRKTKIG